MTDTPMKRGIIDAIREHSSDLPQVEPSDKMLEEIFSYSPPGPKMFYYEGRCWRTSPVGISDGDSSGPWREPTEEEIARLPKILRKNA